MVMGKVYCMEGVCGGYDQGYDLTATSTTSTYYLLP